MIAIEDVADTNIMEFTLDGDLSREQFQLAVARMRAKHRQFGSVRAVGHVCSLPAWSVRAFWKEIRLIRRATRYFSHLAIVGRSRGLTLVCKAAEAWSRRTNAPCQVRCFPEAELERARDWLELESEHSDPSKVHSYLQRTLEHSAWIP